MTINFKYGFEYKGFTFGWKEQNLFRLPSKKYNRHYPLKKLSKIKVGSKDGYRVVREKKSISQLMELTEVINYTYTVNGKQSKDTPFQ